MQRVLARSYIATPEGERWESGQRAALPQIESVDASYFGWRQFRLRLGEARYLFVYLPPNFPGCRYVLHQTADSASRVWSAMGVWRKSPGLTRFAIKDLYTKVMEAENASGATTLEEKRGDMS